MKSPLAVWTGSEIIVWGRKADEPCCNGGGALYDPGSDTWTPMTAEGAPANAPRAAVWTGTEFLLFTGGELPEGGGAYDPVTNRWRPLRIDTDTAVGSGVWTGSEMFAWNCRWQGDDPGGAIYDLQTDSWRTLPLEGAPRGVAGSSLIWTGTEAIVWGGQTKSREDVAEGARFPLP